MFTVNNPKVARFAPVWAPFPGFSLLFDNPGSGLRPSGNGMLTVAGDVDSDPELSFYRTLWTALCSLDLPLLTGAYLFCALPPASYHVTVWDGGNAGNLAKVTPARRPELEAVLADVPAALRRPDELLALPLASPLAAPSSGDWAIRLRFDALALWGSSVLVARLAPADPLADGVLSRIEEERRTLSTAFRAAFGIAPGDRFRPHVSLGYFANRESGQLATAVVPVWNEILSSAMEGHTIEFPSIRLYGFTDMATFFRGA